MLGLLRKLCVAALAAIALTLRADACSCANVSKAEGIAMMSFVAEGEVVGFAFEDVGSEKLAVTRIKVSKVIKILIGKLPTRSSSAPDIVELLSSAHGAACGWGGTVGERLTFGLFYEERDLQQYGKKLGPGQHWINACTMHILNR